MRSDEFKVVIVDDCKPILAKVEKMVAAIDFMTIVGIADNERDAVIMLDKFKPDCVIFDFNKAKLSFHDFMKKVEERKSFVIVDLHKLRQLFV